MSDWRIPFNKPWLTGKELEYMAAAVENGHISGCGPYSKKCQALLETRYGIRRALLTTSCTAALDATALLLDIKPGDEIIMPSYTFVSTANAFYIRGATIRFVDIRADTLNIDETLIEAAVTDKTRAIVVVHYAGVGCEMDRIMSLAAKYNLPVIEDAAQAIEASYRGKQLGSIGDLGAYSFHETKNVIAGEGGALLINNEAYIERAEVVYEKGTNRKAFSEGRVDKYTWVDAGSSFAASDLIAAFLLAQLENSDNIKQRRKQIYSRYHDGLSPLAEEGRIGLPCIPEECDSNYHNYFILLPDNSARGSLIEYLDKKGIMAVFHYIPLHTSPVGRSLGYRDGMLPVTEDVAGRLLRLPFYYELGDDDIDDVVTEVSGFVKSL
jgi:dTDP-4-amino-4,6-dideoxygalactose transaminase